MTTFLKTAALEISANLLRAVRDRIEAGESEFNQGCDRQQTLLLVVGEGATEPEANALVAKLTRLLWEGMNFGWAETCYGEIARPSLNECLEQAPALGLSQVIVFPWIGFNPPLLERIQNTVAGYRQTHRTDKIVMVSPVDNHPLLLDRATQDSSTMNCQFCRYRETSATADVGKA